MGSRRLVVSAWAAVSLWSATASADQDVELEALALTITVPDGWVHEFRSDMDVFTHADGTYIGAFVMMVNDCASVIPQLKAQSAATLVDETAPVEGWSGFAYTDGDHLVGSYCRDVTYPDDAARSVGPELAPPQRAALLPLEHVMDAPRKRR